MLLRFGLKIAVFVWCICVHAILKFCVCYVCLQAQYVYAHECIKVAIENGMHLTGRLNGPMHGNCLLYSL